jgi:hypothetical protein
MRGHASCSRRGLTGLGWVSELRCDRVAMCRYQLDGRDDPECLRAAGTWLRLGLVAGGRRVMGSRSLLVGSALLAGVLLVASAPPPAAA